MCFLLSLRKVHLHPTLAQSVFKLLTWWCIAVKGGPVLRSKLSFQLAAKWNHHQVMMITVFFGGTCSPYFTCLWMLTVYDIVEIGLMKSSLIYCVFSLLPQSHAIFREQSFERSWVVNECVIFLFLLRAKTSQHMWECREPCLPWHGSK